MSMPGFVYQLQCRSCKERSPTYPLYVRAMHDPIVSLPAWSRTHRRWLYMSIQVGEKEFLDSVVDSRRLQELASGLSSSSCTVGVPRAHEGMGLVIEPEPECPYCGGKVAVFALGKEQGTQAEQNIASDCGDTT
jgi:hypothetical protein